MKLRVRYENIFEIIEVDLDDMKSWLNINIEDNVNIKEIERQIQEEFDKQFNKPEYNNLHKFQRHRGFSKASDELDEIDTSEPLIDEVKDARIFFKDEIELNNQWDYEDICQKIHNVLPKESADMIISICVDGLKVNEYAKQIGDKANNVSKRLNRQKDKLKKLLK
jgi:hypothetical protein